MGSSQTHPRQSYSTERERRTSGPGDSEDAHLWSLFKNFPGHWESWRSRIWDWQKPEGWVLQRLSRSSDMLNLMEKEIEAHRSNDLFEATGKFGAVRTGPRFPWGGWSTLGFRQSDVCREWRGLGPELWIQILILVFIIALQPVGSQLGSLSLCPQLQNGDNTHFWGCCEDQNI